MNNCDQFEVGIFVTGMHMLRKYGYTCLEVERVNSNSVYKYINQNQEDSMDIVLAKTISGLSDYVKEMQPDMIIVHGDRVEALAGSIVGSLNNILVSHIEGGEVSGTIDELIRHSVSKMSQIHFVSNDNAKKRLIQLGESSRSIKIIGSPDLDIMKSKKLPSIEKVKERYEIPYQNYGIALFHPVTTQLKQFKSKANIFVDSLIKSDRNYVVIYPNNDSGTHFIMSSYKKLKVNKKFILIPSMRFEYFLTLIKCSDFMIGNSSAGVREAPFEGIPSINVGTRQFRRANAPTIINTSFDIDSITNAIKKTSYMDKVRTEEFGDGYSTKLFTSIMLNKNTWNIEIQKSFKDI